ncbi:MAG: hypothetical protein HQM16_11935 [Deltaproteobacteria bacterium]|nr:hypothetical protein [Deltaproteobacteria bacterium]
MQFDKFSPDTISELLIFLAEHEQFESLKSIKNISKADVSTLLKDLANQINDMTAKSTMINKDTLTRREFPEAVNRVVSKLTPQEENLLLKSFGVS